MSPDRSRRCPFTGCTNRLPAAKFACGTHWFTLTREQQSRIYAAYGRWLRQEIDGETLRRLQQEVLDETAIGGTA